MEIPKKHHAPSAVAVDSILETVGFATCFGVGQINVKPFKSYFLLLSFT